MTNTPNDGGRTPPNSPASGDVGSTTKEKLEALESQMRELAQTSDDCQYGTISTGCVRGWADELAALRESLGGEGDAGNIVEAWAVVCLALHEAVPHWMDHERDNEWNAGEAAANAIRNLSTPRAAEAVSEEMRMAVRFAPSSAYWSQKLVEFFGPDARDGIAALEDQLRAALTPPSPGAAK
jgi:hypothetical protein